MVMVAGVFFCSFRSRTSRNCCLLWSSPSSSLSSTCLYCSYSYKCTNNIDVCSQNTTSRAISRIAIARPLHHQLHPPVAPVVMIIVLAVTIVFMSIVSRHNQHYIDCDHVMQPSYPAQSLYSPQPSSQILASDLVHLCHLHSPRQQQPPLHRRHHSDFSLEVPSTRNPFGLDILHEGTAWGLNIRRFYRLSAS